MVYLFLKRSSFFLYIASHYEASMMLWLHISSGFGCNSNMQMAKQSAYSQKSGETTAAGRQHNFYLFRDILAHQQK